GRAHSFRISPNPGTKSVKEHATKQPVFANPETVFGRKQCCNVKSKTTLGNGYLGSRIDEERSEMRYLVRSEEHTSEPPCNLVCRLLLEKKNDNQVFTISNPQICACRQ